MSKDNSLVMDVKNLVVHYETDEGIVEAVNDVSLQIHKGEILGLVGETGAGKTTLALSMMNLLPYPPSHVIGGEVLLEGKDVMKMSKSEILKVRGKKISMIFQDPMTALNPVKYVGDQIAEVAQIHEKCSKAESVQRAMEMMKTVGIHPERYKEYPHQFSGGMKQRIVIAIALACQPELLIADEPTTALDVTIQAQVLDLMRQLQRKMGTAIMFITHDLGVIREMCDRVIVMYCGEIMEQAPTRLIFENPSHPYTKGLLNTLPKYGQTGDLPTIKGMVPPAGKFPSGCVFAPRCPYATDKCREEKPQLTQVEEGHMVSCFYPDMVRKEEP